jgi:putative endonuclease
MFAGRLTQTAMRALDWLAAKTLPPEDLPAHQLTGRRGEEDAYFYLRRCGYTIISRNFRSPNHRGELDLVGWIGRCCVLSK